MKERPVIFTGDSVRAILAGRKTQTRRIVKPQPQKTRSGWEWVTPRVTWYWPGGIHTCPYGKPGDRLWVRETWATDFEKNVLYRTTDPSPSPMGAYGAKRMVDGAKSIWRSPIHMPRWASRITLEITGVRAERLQEISEADAQREGWSFDQQDVFQAYDPVTMDTARRWFQANWDSINGKRALWASNPYVWVVEFSVL